MEFLDVLQIIVMAIALGGLMLLMITALVDQFTLEDVGTKSVPCIDRNHRPFENEMCTKKLTCSWLGFVSNSGRCVNVLEDEA